MELVSGASGGSGSSVDGANAKRKLDIAHSTPMTMITMDSQSKVRRRGSSLSSNDSAMMKRSLSDGTITARTHYDGSDSEQETGNAISCPISPSSDTMSDAAALAEAAGVGVARLSPFSTSTSHAATSAMGPFATASPRPGFFLPSPACTRTASSAPTSPQQLATPLTISQNFGESLTVSTTSIPALGRSSTLPKRQWQPSRKSRNPGNLSLDLSQMDQTSALPADGKCALRRNEQAAVCSQVTDFLYIGGAAAAKDRDNLQQVGISHIINCAASVAPAFFPEDFMYYNIRLRDHSSQDISRYFYNVFDFIEKARRRGGKVFVHCVKGISRSPTMAIAYLMWYKHIDVYKALDFVRQARPAVDPNAGFIFQLTEWEHMHVGGKIKLQRPIVFRIELPGGSNGNGNGARAAEKPLIVGPLASITETDFLHPSEEIAKSCFIVSCGEYMCIWCGAHVTEVQVEAAQHAVVLLQLYESFPDKYELVTSGQESPALWSVLESLHPPHKSA